MKGPTSQILHSGLSVVSRPLLRNHRIAFIVRLPPLPSVSVHFDLDLPLRLVDFHVASILSKNVQLIEVCNVNFTKIIQLFSCRNNRIVVERQLENLGKKFIMFFWLCVRLDYLFRFDMTTISLDDELYKLEEFENL